MILKIKVCSLYNFRSFVDTWVQVLCIQNFWNRNQNFYMRSFCSLKGIPPCVNFILYVYVIAVFSQQYGDACIHQRLHYHLKKPKTSSIEVSYSFIKYESLTAVNLCFTAVSHCGFQTGIMFTQCLLKLCPFFISHAPLTANEHTGVVLNKPQPCLCIGRCCCITPSSIMLRSNTNSQA